jgi:hypothetical protein
MLQEWHDDSQTLLLRVDVVQYRLEISRRSTLFLKVQRLTAGSRRRERQRLKSGPWTVAARDLRRMLMMTSGLDNWGLNWYLV